MVPGIPEPKIEMEERPFPHLPLTEMSSHEFRVPIKVLSEKERHGVSESI